MRVLNVITRLNIGGASPPVIALAAGLRQRGHESALIVGTPEPSEGSMTDDARQAGVQVIQLSALTRNPHPGRDLAAMYALLREFRRFRPDVVATHMSKAGALGRVAARLTGVPVVVHTYHGKGFHVFDSRWKETAALIIERALARTATASIVVSDRQRDEFVRLGIDRPERIYTIRYGLDLARFSQVPPEPLPVRREMTVSSDDRVIGVIGRLVAIKGQDVFLRAAAALAPRFPDVRFVLVGDGDRRAEYEALARELGLGARVLFLGWRRDVPSILSALDLVVLPTVNDFEGTPLAVIEALAAGRPVIASDVGGVAEVVRDGITGRLVPPRNVSALADAMSSMLEDPAAAARLGAAGQQLVLDRYQRERMIDETESYFLRLLARRGRTRGD